MDREKRERERREGGSREHFGVEGVEAGEEEMYTGIGREKRK